MFVIFLLLQVSTRVFGFLVAVVAVRMIVSSITHYSRNYFVITDLYVRVTVCTIKEQQAGRVDLHVSFPKLLSRFE